MRSLTLPLVFLAFLGSLLASTACPAKSNVTASLISNVSAIAAGKPFDMAVRLEMVPNWHTYWSNPGDAGLATQVRWALPPGFTAGPLQFPVPTRIDEPGGIVVYGYTGEVLLVATITPPAELPIDTPVEFTAKVNWLCCAEVCVPGAAMLQATLPVAKEPVVSNAELFDRWRTHLPTPSSAIASPMHLNDEHPHAEVFVDHPFTESNSIIPAAVDGLIVKIGKPQPQTRNGIAGTVIPIDGQVLKGQTISDKRLLVLLTRPDPSHNDSADGRTGEAVLVPLETSISSKE